MRICSDHRPSPKHPLNQWFPTLREIGCGTADPRPPPCRHVWSCDLHRTGPPAFDYEPPSPSCRAHYPGGPNRCMRRSLPGCCGLPRFSGGSASATTFEACQACALRPNGLLARLTRLCREASARPVTGPRCSPASMSTDIFIGGAFQGVRASTAHVRGRARWLCGSCCWPPPCAVSVSALAVSRPRSSNRTCGFPASGSPTGFTSSLSQAAAPVAPRAGAARPSPASL